MVELEINDKNIELESDTQISFTRQIADVFDIGNVSNSFSTSFAFHKTPNNTQAVDGLGIVGDLSQAPYVKNTARLKMHGIPIVSQGWFNVKETAEQYKGSVIDGMIDFFKAIENKTMGKDVDLSNFSHEKDLPTVIASFDNEYYTYIIADYNGRQMFKLNVPFAGATVINIDYLVPCFNVGKLLEAVMSSFGYEYDNTNIEELDELYITYPKAPNEAVTEDVAVELYKNPWVSSTFAPFDPETVWVPSQQAWNVITVTQGEMQSDAYVIPASGVYRIAYSVESYAKYRLTNDTIFDGGIFDRSIRFSIFANGVPIKSVATDPLDPVTGELLIYLNEGDLITRAIHASPTLQGQIGGGSEFIIYEIRHNSTDLDIYRTNQGNIDLNDAFKDFKVTDFFKEILWHTGTTPILNQDAREISFLSIAQRLDVNNAQDWSDKFIRRTTETYTDGSYAQKNAFKHKYNDENDISNDGYIYLNNQNVEDEKAIVTSKIYAPDGVLFRFYNPDQSESFTTDRFRTWNAETKEDEDENIAIEYKGLNQRFYFIKKRDSQESDWRFGSEIVDVEPEEVPIIPIGITTGTTFDQVVPVKYAEYSAVLDRLKVHKIELALNVAHFNAADLTRPFYFEQEASSYMMNKLTFKEGDTCIAECVKISKVIEPDLSGYQINVQVGAVDLGRLRVKFVKQDGYDTVISGSASIGDNTYPIEGFVPSAFPVVTLVIEDIADLLSLNSFTIRVSNGVDEKDYVYSGPTVTFTASDVANNSIKNFTALIENV